MIPLDYILLVILYSGILLSIYALVWQLRSVLAGRRAFLMLCAVLPLLLPFIRLQVANPSPFPIPAMPLQEVRVGAGHIGPLDNGSPINGWLIGYLAIAATVLLGYLFSYLKLQMALKQGGKARKSTYTLRTATGIGPGTLGRTVFIPGEFCEQAIISHEVAHITLGHRFDLLLMLLIQSFCWFNPFIWIVVRELKTVHELEADAETVRSCDRGYYQKLLLSQAFSVPSSLLIHSFFNHPIKRRIIMLQTTPSTRRAFTTTAALMLTLAMIGSALYAQTVHKKAKATTGSVSKEDSLRIIRGFQDRMNSPEGKKQLKEAGKPAILSDGRMVYKFVDHMPHFKGDLSAYLVEHLHYPDSARAHNQEGRSVVQFIVDENGKVVQSEVVRSSGFALLDEEAVRAVSTMPAWTPGKQAGSSVNVYFTMPISFKLD